MENKDSKNFKTKVTTRPNGPIIVDGNFILDDGDGNLSEHKRLSLCRCAASSKMPFCDGAHNRVNFQS